MLYRCFLVLIVAGICFGDGLIGDGDDGNDSGPVHVIGIYDQAGDRIRSGDENPEPFSMRQTCGKCHDYDRIASGWHFNGHNASVDPGRIGQSWVMRDVKTRTQVPVSGRDWDGAFTPEELGVTPWQFVKSNFSHFPGGGYGQMMPDDPDEEIRQEISGEFEINCLACHSADRRYDASDGALQAARENYKWIAAKASGKAMVSGVAASLDDYFDPEYDQGVEVEYADGVFDSENMVYFDITKHASNERCSFCHSSAAVSGDDGWRHDKDVHLTSGLTCVDCHRNGDDHAISRGDDVHGADGSLSCEGCHLGGMDFAAGRLGAPMPEHRGIPSVHFEKLACSACHSGPVPGEVAGKWKEARIHKTGLHGKHGRDTDVPSVYGPVMMRGEDGKIVAHKMFWPAYWGRLDGDKVLPLERSEVFETAGVILDAQAEKDAGWRVLTTEQIGKVLAALGDKAVYIAGGRLYKLDGAGKVTSDAHDAAKPYAWAMGHDVCGAEQALGAGGCKDCHTTDSAFFFGKVPIDTPVEEAGEKFVEMIDFQNLDRKYIKAFNASFVFRPILKIVAFAACGLIGLILLAYGLRAVGAISGSAKEAGKCSEPLR